MCGGYCFCTTREHVEQGCSKVDYAGLVDDKSVVLAEAEPPLVMKMMGDMLPARGFELKWVRNQSLVPKILQKVSTRVLRCNTGFDGSRTNCIGRFISGSGGDGSAVLYVPQLLDRLSSRHRR